MDDFDSFPYWPHDRFSGPTFEFDHFDDDPSLEFTTQNDVVSYSVPENQVIIDSDLFHQRFEEFDLMGTHEIVLNSVNDSTFGEIDENYDVGIHPFELELGLGLDFDDEEHDNLDDFIVNVNESRHSNESSSGLGGLRPIWIELGSDCEVEALDDALLGVNVNPIEEEFVLGNVNSNDNDDDFNVNVNDESRDSNESSSRVSRLRPMWVESGLDCEVEANDNVSLGVNVNSNDNDDDFNVNVEVNDEIRDSDESSSRVSRLRPIWVESGWDCEVEANDDVLLGVNANAFEEFVLGNVNDNDDGVEENRDFVWEDMDDDGIIESESVRVLEERLVSLLGLEEDGEEARSSSNLDWEVLLDVPSLNTNSEMENGDRTYFGVVDDHIDYEMMFGQFTDGENAGLGLPPASKAVVEKLPSVVITKEDAVDGTSLCAVCKDHIEVGEEGKQLPCSHRYHGDCIIPWLGIRNTCPVCRFELPTDDPDYEQRRVSRAAPVA